MGFRFRKSIKIMPGIRLNLGSKSASVSIGGRGASLNVSSKGVYSNLGIPGTGLSYRTKLTNTSTSSIDRTNLTSATQTRIRPTDRISLSEIYKIGQNVVLKLAADGSVNYQDNYGSSLSDKIVAALKKDSRATIEKWLEEQCNQYNQDIKGIIFFHLSTLSADTEIVFIPSPFNVKEPKPTTRVQFNVPKPNIPQSIEYGWAAKLFSFYRKRTDEQNKSLMDNFQIQTKNWEQQREQFSKKQELLHNQYLIDHSNWKKHKEEFEQIEAEKQKLIQEKRFNDTEAMSNFLTQSIESIAWPRETIVSFDINKNNTALYLDVDLPEIQDMPTEEASIDNKSLRLKIKEKSEAQIRREYITHIHAIGFRLIGEAFVTLPTIVKVVLSAYSQRPDKSTGYIRDEYLYSVKVDRSQWAKIDFNNLEQVDVVECIGSFEIRRKINRQGFISPIEPFN